MSETALDRWCEAHGASYSARFEMERILAIPQRRVECVLEVGSYRGDSLRVWIEAFKPVLAIGIEAEMSPRIYSGLNDLPDCAMILAGDSTSSLMFKRVSDAVGNLPVDFLYIDGDHEFPAPLIDYSFYRTFVRPGGTIVFDDARTEPGVKDTISTIPDGTHIYGGGDSGGKYVIEKERE